MTQHKSWQHSSWWLWRYCYRWTTDMMSQKFRHNRKTSMENIAQLWNLKYQNFSDLSKTRTPYDSLVVVFARFLMWLFQSVLYIYLFAPSTKFLHIDVSWFIHLFWHILPLAFHMTELFSNLIILKMTMIHKPVYFSMLCLILCLKILRPVVSWLRVKK